MQVALDVGIIEGVHDRDGGAVAVSRDCSASEANLVKPVSVPDLRWRRPRRTWRRLGRRAAASGRKANMKGLYSRGRGTDINVGGTQMLQSQKARKQVPAFQKLNRQAHFWTGHRH